MPRARNCFALVAAATIAILPAHAAVAARGNPIGLGPVGFATDQVDVTQDFAVTDLTWSITDSDTVARALRGTVELRPFVGDQPVESARTIAFGLDLGYPYVSSESGSAQSSAYRFEFLVPREGVAANVVWRVTKVTAEDDQGHKRTFKMPGAELAVTGLVDTTGPEIRIAGADVGQVREVYDPGTGVALRYRLEILDEGSAPAKGRIILRGPGGSTLTGKFQVEDNGYQKTCGDGSNFYDPFFLSCTAVAQVPAGSPSGTWTPARVEVWDRAGNVTRLAPENLPAITVSRNDMITASDFQLPATVSAPAQGVPSADLTFAVSGAVGGLASVDLDSDVCTQTSHTPEVAAGGRVSVKIEIRSLTGRCTVTGVKLTDTAGNVSFYGSSHGNTDLGLTIVVV
jgi:hypothetical protein